MVGDCTMKAREDGIGRRQALRRLVAYGGSAAALPTLDSAVPVSRSQGAMQSSLEPIAMGSAMPPEPALSSKHWVPIFFDSHQNQTVIALSDLIIPDTDTPGAKTAQVNRFIDFLLAAEPVQEQKSYIEALSWLDGYSFSRYAGPFTGLTHDEQLAILTSLTSPSRNSELSQGIERFGILKASIVQAYYTSEIGMLKQLKYQMSPYQPGFPGCKDGP